ncbi:antibiotic biosynthesis monooxygenase [Nocardioides ungokensis]|uniref:antibiotic biosynthesis monooxygenase n=1 Tax=Nocardioides ungokensis TaxID=1643322 RepID=UPI001FE9A232|nr:antibiotic biosynthesis monooxygenase [Nocardioides ungokensis]
MTSPVTVSITRHLDPGREAEMMSWMSAGVALAERFPGFLGAGWVRPEQDSETWHVLYRFADHEALAGWESSHERQWWRDASVGLGVVESRVERRTGIEGWFDEPVTRDLRDLRLSPPRRALQAGHGDLAGVLPPEPAGVLDLLPGGSGPPAAGPGTDLDPADDPGDDLLVLPWMTRRLSWWLQGEPPPWRRVAAA